MDGRRRRISHLLPDPIELDLCGYHQVLRVLKREELEPVAFLTILSAGTSTESRERERSVERFEFFRREK